MRDQFVGDVGDFGKYGLLRRLIGLTDPDTPTPDLTLGVVWYYRRNVAGEDGKFVQYLKLDYYDRARYERCDPELWSILGDLVCNGKRFVCCVEQSATLPEGTRYFRDLLSFEGVPSGKRRQQHRSDWLQRALHATEGADIVFLDPDNNIRLDERYKYDENGPKYAYLDEIRAFWERGQSVVVYHQLNRNRTAEAQITEMSDCLSGVSGVDPIPMWFRRGTSRVFFVIPQDEHRDQIETRITEMLEGPWGQHFTDVTR